MNERLVKTLDEMEYAQVGTLEAIYVKPHRPIEEYLDDVDIQVVRAIPRWSQATIPRGLEKACTDYFRWFIKANWKKLLQGRDVLLSKGFARDSNSVLGACHLVDLPLPGRKYSMAMLDSWDITKELRRLPEQLNSDSLYRFKDGEWSVLTFAFNHTKLAPGNMWDVKTGVDIEETTVRTGRWMTLYLD